MIPEIYVVFIIVAIGIAVVAEIMVAYQKYQMKKQFVEELNEQELNKDPIRGHE